MSETKKLNTEVTRPDVPEQYQGLLDANPYLNLDYKQSGWQKFMSALGFRTNYDAYKESMQVQANEYNASVAEKAYNEQYESPAAEASRARAAGLNPDLTGVEGVSGASPMADDGNPPIPSESDAAQVGQFANMIFSAVSMATGFAKDFGALRSLKLANDNQEVSNVRNLFDTAFDAVTHYYPTEPTPHGINSAQQLISDTVRGSFRSKRNYRRFVNASGVLFGSAATQSDFFKTLKERVSNRKDYYMASSSKFYNEDEEVLRDVIGPLVELNDRALKASAKADAIGAENQSQLAEAAQAQGLPISEVSEAVAENEQKSQEFNMQKELRSTLSKIIHSLQERANTNKPGHGFSETLLLVLSVMSMISFNSGSSSQSMGPKGMTTTKSGPSFGF